jgi:hypothetical protein
MNTVEWKKKQQNYRYSQDERQLSYKFMLEIDEKIQKFLDEYEAKTLILGPYNMEKEQWRLKTIQHYFRNFVTVKEEDATDNLKKLVLGKKKTLHVSK